MTRGIRIQWYPRDPASELEAAAQLTLEERGALGTVIDLIYARANDLRDDDRFIAGHCGCDVRVWRRIKARLLALGRLYVKTDEAGGARLCNTEADDGVAKALAMITAKRYAGAQSAAAKAAKSDGQHKQNRRLASTPVATPVGTSVRHNNNNNNNSSLSERDSSTAPPARDPTGAHGSLSHLGKLGDALTARHGLKALPWFEDAKLVNGTLVPATPAKYNWISNHFAKDLDGIEIAKPEAATLVAA